MVWGILWFFAILIADLWMDYHKWLDGKEVKHTLEWWQRAVCIAPAFGMASGGFLQFCGVALFGGVLYWNLFDGVFNLMRGLNWWYPGSDDGKKDALLDRLQMWLGPHGSKVIKLGGLLIALVIAIKLTP